MDPNIDVAAEASDSEQVRLHDLSLTLVISIPVPWGIGSVLLQ